MIPVNLTYLRASDGVRLEGVVVLPKRKNTTALIWIHGLGSRFSSGQTILQELSRACQKNGIAYFKFNNRGHDYLNKDTKPFGGSGFEHFEDCIKDIRAMILFAKKLGYRKIILAGHSSGANKVLYYMYKIRDRSVKGLTLLAPISDIAVDYKLFGKKEIKKRLTITGRLYKKNPNQLLPQKYGVWSARRYLSILTPGKSEDVFPYHNPSARWKELRSIKIPVTVIVGSRDEYLDRPAKKLIEIFRQNAASTKHFSGVIVKGAKHGFQKKEKELSAIILAWIKKI